MLKPNLTKLCIELSKQLFIKYSNGCFLVKEEHDLKEIKTISGNASIFTEGSKIFLTLPMFTMINVSFKTKQKLEFIVLAIYEALKILKIYFQDFDFIIDYTQIVKKLLKDLKLETTLSPYVLETFTEILLERLLGLNEN